MNEHEEEQVRRKREYEEYMYGDKEEISYEDELIRLQNKIDNLTEEQHYRLSKGEWKMFFEKARRKKLEEQIVFWENEIKELREQLEKGEITYDYFLETFKSFEEILEDKRRKKND